MWLFANRSELVQEVYAAIVRSELARGVQHVEGLHELLTDKAFEPFKGRAVVQLLREFPNAPMQPLSSLLRGSLERGEIRTEFVGIAEKV